MTSGRPPASTSWRWTVRSANGVGAAIERLANDPRPSGAEALKGRRGYLRIRVGDYRVIYTVRDDQLIVLVTEVGKRGEVYRGL